MSSVSAKHRMVDIAFLGSNSDYPAVKIDGDNEVHTFTDHLGFYVESTPLEAWGFLSGLENLSWDTSQGKSRGFFFNTGEYDSPLIIPKWRWEFKLLFSCGVHNLYQSDSSPEYILKLNDHITHKIHELGTMNSTFSGAQFFHYVMAIRIQHDLEVPFHYTPRSKKYVEGVSMSVSGGAKKSDCFNRGHKYHRAHTHKLGDSISQSHFRQRALGKD